MKLTFVSHAGFIVETNGKRIFSDPWTKGKAFNDGWSLLVPAAEVDYATIDYIFVTHEHPDHFSFPTLKSIPEADKRRIRILYQKHASKRLVDAFHKLGFATVTELPIYRWFEIDGIQLFCGSVGSMDSFLAIRDNDHTVLNLNDCVLNTKQCNYVRRLVGTVDLLLTQFSFANWVGNDQDDMDGAGQKIRQLTEQTEVFSPRYTVPFASFIYFCNQENCRLNDWINTPQMIDRLGLRGVNFMYPGDEIDLKDPKFRSPEAVERYMAALDRIAIDPTPNTVTFQEICDAVNENLQAFRERVPLPLRICVKPISIFVHDLDRAILVDPRQGTCKEIRDKVNCRYHMCGQVCWYTFKFGWGTATLEVSGMYRDEKLNEKRSYYFFLQNLHSTEFINFQSLPDVLRTMQFLYRKKWEFFHRFV